MHKQKTTRQIRGDDADYGNNTEIEDKIAQLKKIVASYPGLEDEYFHNKYNLDKDLSL